MNADPHLFYAKQDHAIRRAAERYKLKNVTYEELADLKRKIVTGRAIPMMRGDTWMVNLRGKNCIVVYDMENDAITTFLGGEIQKVAERSMRR